MTNGILKSINHRNKLYKNLKQFKPDSFIYTEKQLYFNRYRNELKKTITHTKRSYYKDFFKQYKFDMKKTWAVLSEILNRNSRNTVPDNMIINGVECSDKQAIVEHFNSFFLLQLENVILGTLLSMMTLVIVTIYQKESNPALNFAWLIPMMSSRL